MPARKKDIKKPAAVKPHIKRPCNAFMLFAREHRKSLSLITGALNAVISVYLGLMWQKLEPAVRAVYAEKAEEERLAHKQAHPDYVYRPVQKKTVINKPEFAEKKRKKTARALPVFANLAADDLFFDDPFRDTPVAGDLFAGDLFAGDPPADDLFADDPPADDLFAEYPFRDPPADDLPAKDLFADALFADALFAAALFAEYPFRDTPVADALH